MMCLRYFNESTSSNDKNQGTQWTNGVSLNRKKPKTTGTLTSLRMDYKNTMW